MYLFCIAGNTQQWKFSKSHKCTKTSGVCLLSICEEWIVETLNILNHRNHPHYKFGKVIHKDTIPKKYRGQTMEGGGSLSFTKWVQFDAVFCTNKVHG